MASVTSLAVKQLFDIVKQALLNPRVVDGDRPNEVVARRNHSWQLILGGYHIQSNREDVRVIQKPLVDLVGEMCREYVLDLMAEVRVPRQGACCRKRVQDRREFSGK